MPKSGLAFVVAALLGLLLEDEVRVGMRVVENRLHEVAVIPLGAGDEVGCEKNLARSVNVLIRDNKGKLLGWVH
jgi:hypothetical protein